MHHIYTTEAVIIKSLPIGEANKLYFLLTKDLGFVRAMAQGVRLFKSKLKGHLETFCLVNISIVKGKNYWRITNIESILQNGVIKNHGKLSVLHNASVLLLRLIHGEEKNDNIFECVKSAYIFCRDMDLSSDELKSLEALIILRIMHFLGYIKKIGRLSIFSESANITPELLENFFKVRKEAVIEINRALAETHL